MASIVSLQSSFNKLSFMGYNTNNGYGVKSSTVSRKRVVVIRADGQSQTINPEIRKSEEKVVDSVILTDLSKPITAYCRCWRSGTFPLCDGAHAKHNKATGDNVGPLLLKNK